MSASSECSCLPQQRLLYSTKSSDMRQPSRWLCRANAALAAADVKRGGLASKAGAAVCRRRPALHRYAAMKRKGQAACPSSPHHCSVSLVGEPLTLTLRGLISCPEREAPPQTRPSDLRADARGNTRGAARPLAAAACGAGGISRGLFLSRHHHHHPRRLPSHSRSSSSTSKRRSPHHAAHAAAASWAVSWWAAGCAQSCIAADGSSPHPQQQLGEQPAADARACACHAREPAAR